MTDQPAGTGGESWVPQFSRECRAVIAEGSHVECRVCGTPADHNHFCTCGRYGPSSTCPLHGCIDWAMWLNLPNQPRPPVTRSTNGARNDG